MKALEEPKIKSQMKKLSVVTEKFLKEMHNKKYFSGREIKVGDHVLFGILCYYWGSKVPPKMSDFQNAKIPIEQKVIVFHPDELKPRSGIYKIVHPKNESKAIKYPYLFFR
jgi:hypothetical protein